MSKQGVSNGFKQNNSKQGVLKGIPKQRILNNSLFGVALLRCHFTVVYNDETKVMQAKTARLTVAVRQTRIERASHARRTSVERTMRSHRHLQMRNQRAPRARRALIKHTNASHTVHRAHIERASRAHRTHIYES